MLGIAELFAELDGYDRYEFALAAHIESGRIKMREYNREYQRGYKRQYQARPEVKAKLRAYYQRPDVAKRQRDQKRARYHADPAYRARKSAAAKARYAARKQAA
jgi:hypothetical protein